MPNRERPDSTIPSFPPRVGQSTPIDLSTLAAASRPLPAAQRRGAKDQDLEPSVCSATIAQIAMLLTLIAAPRRAQADSPLSLLFKKTLSKMIIWICSIQWAARKSEAQTHYIMSTFNLVVMLANNSRCAWHGTTSRATDRTPLW
jgi:hypothetical protein